KVPSGISPLSCMMLNLLPKGRSTSGKDVAHCLFCQFRSLISCCNMSSCRRELVDANRTAISRSVLGPSLIAVTIIFEKSVRRRNFMKNTILITSLAVAFGLTTNVAAQSSAAQQGAPTVKTGSALKAKAASPAPSATAKSKSQKTTIGKGKAAAKASAPSSYWTEEVDVHDDGSAETTEFLYDAQRGIVHAYGEDDFSCANGNPEKAGILEAVYATGNKAGMPVGSGYYIVGLNGGQCAAKNA